MKRTLTHAETLRPLSTFVQETPDMHYEVKHSPSEPAWTVLRVDGAKREVVETHYGDHCDANERRYARERAQTLARTLARKDNTHAVLNA